MLLNCVEPKIYYWIHLKFDGILEIARSIQTNYSYVNVVTCVILPRGDSWSVNRMPIREINQILK